MPDDAPLIVVRGDRDPQRWRTVARSLLGQGVSPSRVQWLDPDDPQQPLAAVTSTREAEPGPACASTSSLASRASRARVPAGFLDVARRVLCHTGATPFDALYRVLHRLTLGGESRLLHDAADPDVSALQRLDKAVRRDAHKMKAFVRFRKVMAAHDAGSIRDDASPPNDDHYVAYHRPDHFILPLVGLFFARRFGVLRWTILTPRGSMSWDGESLRFGPPAPRHAAPTGDALDDLWRSYYASIFNPARVNPAAMQREMPRKFWQALPEADLIERLLREAGPRTRAMIDGAPKEHRSAADFLPPGPAPLPLLAQASKACQGCELFKLGTQTVFGEGSPTARMMLVGEQPGDAEDVAGKPFVGPAGALLDRALAEAGIDRASVYVTNAVKHFKWTPAPRGKRRIHSKPDAAEVRACRPWLEQEIGAVRPDVIVLLGATAAQSLLGAGFRVTKQRGVPIENTTWARVLVATFHPSAVLRAIDDATRKAQYDALVADLRVAAALLGTPE